MPFVFFDHVVVGNVDDFRLLAVRKDNSEKLVEQRPDHRLAKSALPLSRQRPYRIPDKEKAP